jgi:hypothetical protein
MNDLAADPWRGARILLFLSILVLLILYGFYFHPGITLSDCLASPDEYDGEIIEVGNEAVIDSVFSDGFTIRQLGKTINVIGMSDDVKSGEFVLMLARFQKPASLEALEIRIAKKRRSKIWLSTIPALLVVGYFFRRFRFNFKHLSFQER